MKALIRAVGAAAILLGAAAGPARADYPTFDKSHRGENLDLSAHKLAWSDDFNTLRISVDGRGSGPWFSGVHAALASGEYIAQATDAAYRAAAGNAVMSTRKDASNGLRVESHMQTADTHGNIVAFQNGYFEGRISVPSALGSHSGMWLLSQEKGKGHVEVDIAECYGFGDQGVHSSTHVWPIAPDTHQYRSGYMSEADLYSGFHLYGVLATDAQFVFYYDRKEIGRIPRLPAQRVPLYIALSVFGNPGQPTIADATMMVDYVKVYLPKS